MSEAAPLINQYHLLDKATENGTRGFDELSDNWKEDPRFGDLSYDLLLTSLCEKAYNEGRRHILMADFGAGKGLGLLRDLRDNTEAGTNLKSFLDAHRDFKVVALGISDAKSIENFGKPIPDQTTPHTQEEQILIYNVPFTIIHDTQDQDSVQQRLRDCLAGLQESFGEDLSFEAIDLFIANYTLMYFWPLTFGQIVEDMARALRPGGYALIHEYDPFVFSVGPDFDPRDKWLAEECRREVRRHGDLERNVLRYNARVKANGVQLEHDLLKSLAKRFNNLDVMAEPTKIALHKTSSQNEPHRFVFFPQPFKERVYNTSGGGL